MRSSTKMIGILSLALGLSSCAVFQKAPEETAASEKVSLNETASFKEAERLIASVQSDQVVLSTRSLKEMLRKERARSQRCEALNSQLRALKSIDIEEIQ